MTTNNENMFNLDNIDNSNNELDLDYLKASIKEYLKLEEEMKALSIALRQRREKYNNLSKTLYMFLNTNNINEIELFGNYEGNELSKRTRESTRGLTYKKLYEIVQEKLKDQPQLLESVDNAVNEIKSVVSVEEVKIQKSKSKAKKIAELPIITDDIVLND